MPIAVTLASLDAATGGKVSGGFLNNVSAGIKNIFSPRSGPGLDGVKAFKELAKRNNTINFGDPNQRAPALERAPAPTITLTTPTSKSRSFASNVSDAVRKGAKTVVTSGPKAIEDLKNSKMGIFQKAGISGGFSFGQASNFLFAIPLGIIVILYFVLRPKRRRR